MMKSRVVMMLAAVALVSGCAGSGPGGGPAPVTDWEAVLTGNNVVPPASTTASGTARLWLDGSDALHFVIGVAGMTTADDARLYGGPPNQNGTPFVTFCGPCTVTNGILAAGRVRPQGITQGDLLNLVRTYGTYIEIRNGGAGLLRGQVRNIATVEARSASPLSPSF